MYYLGRGQLRVHVELGLPISGLRAGEIMLDCLGGPSVITRVIKSGRGRQLRKSQNDAQHETDSTSLCHL